MTERESLLLSGFYICHPDIVIVDKTDEVRVPGADFGVHARACILALDLCGVHWRSLKKASKLRFGSTTKIKINDIFVF